MSKWKLDEFFALREWYLFGAEVRDADNELIAIVVFDEDPNVDEEDIRATTRNPHSDAHRIVAAPEMEEALQALGEVYTEDGDGQLCFCVRLRQWVDPPWQHEESCLAARAALGKACGEDQG